MRSHTPSGDPPGRRGSVSNRFRASTGASALPRPHTSLRESRTFRATQPTYNLFTGGDNNANASRPGSRQSLVPESVRAASRESSKENMAPPDAAEYESQRQVIEELKAELGTLRYTISTFEQEKQMADARHTAELEDQRRRAQADFAAKQAADAERSQALRQLDAAQRELADLRDAAQSDASAMERRARAAEDEARLLQEQLDDLSSAKDEAARIAEKKTVDLEMRLHAAQKASSELEQEAHAREAALQQVQSHLAERDGLVGELEAEVLRLKAQTGDAETMAIIKRELSEQVTHIRNLEATNREQLADLKHLRQIHRAVEVVQEEKRSLQRKLEAAQSLEAELAEARIQRQRLEDERLAWTAYLASTDTGTDAEFEFDSPEAVARALVQERLTSASHVERIGALQAELAAQESSLRSLHQEHAALRSQLAEAKSATAAQSVDKSRLRIERQRVLAVKEVEYLRAQLKTFDAEDEAFQPESVDETRTRRIQELEDLVDNYRSEIQALHTEMSSLESGNKADKQSSLPPPPPPPQQQQQQQQQPAAAAAAAAGTKRPRDENEEAAAHEQLGLLTRKNRKLQDHLSAVQTQHAVTQKELSVAKEQLKALKAQSKTRILSLRSNPTSDFEAVKLSTLTALKQENADLLSQLLRRPRCSDDDHDDASSSVKLVPASQLDAANRLVQEARAETASAQKSARRLKEVWSKKSLEFKEAIFSTLGWTVVFMPNGKMRVESVFYPSLTEDEHENSIVFDGERGTMKVGGGPRSAFARRIADQIGFWVREKGCIPGFLAALTLEFYEEHARNQQAAAE